MKQIDIDDDVYAYIASQTVQIGESASDILRRLLHFSIKSPKGTAGTAPQPTLQHEFSKLLDDPSVRRRPATAIYLLVLAEAYKQKPNNFCKVLQVRGRERIYFAKSEQEILDSGSSTHPKPIPDTPFWAMTNASNLKKASVAEDALAAMGFSAQARHDVGIAIRERE